MYKFTSMIGTRFGSPCSVLKCRSLKSLANVRIKLYNKLLIHIKNRKEPIVLRGT